MKIAVRVDASFYIGTGHVMRCLTLSDELGKHGGEIFFICQEIEGNLIGFIESKGYRVFSIPENRGEPYRPGFNESDFDWNSDARQSCEILQKYVDEIDLLVVDHYALDINWETRVSQYANRIMVIDDLANRKHKCDLLLDQNFYEDMHERYNTLIPEHCIKLTGPQYVLLRAEFAKMRRCLGEKSGFLNRILVFFGGSDPSNESVKVLKAILSLNKHNLTVDVIIGKNNKFNEEIELLVAGNPQISCYIWTNDMARLMREADLFIGAAGTSTWERCCLGLPALIVTIAENQVLATRALAENGMVWYLGKNTNVKEKDIKDALQQCLDSPAILQGMAKKSLELVDGMGVERCAAIIRTLQTN